MAENPEVQGAPWVVKGGHVVRSWYPPSSTSSLWPDVMQETVMMPDLVWHHHCGTMDARPGLASSLRYHRIPDLIWHHRCSSCGTYRGTFRFPTLTYIVSLCPQLSGHWLMPASRWNWCPFPDAENLICHLCNAILCGYAIDIQSFSSIFCNRNIITRPTTPTQVGSWLPGSGTA